ncbi:MAG: division/cell wall cluster transcriptional repressor MraZ [Thermoleophilia bacterium]
MPEKLHFGGIRITVYVMEESEQSITFFTGEFEHALDDKGRLTLPALYRKNFPADSEAFFVPAAHGEKCVRVFNEQGWAEYDRKYVQQLNEFDARDVSRKIGALYRLIRQAKVDKGGRIVLPASHVQALGLKNKVTMAGHRDHFEIWDPEEYERFLESFDGGDS